MRPFPTLFYIACIILLAIRLRTLNHSASNSLSSFLLWWQRVGFGLRVGWIYRLVTASLTWLRKSPSDSILPLTSPEFSVNRAYIPMWRMDVLVRGVVSRSLESLGCLWKRSSWTEVFGFRIGWFGDRVKEIIGYV